MTVGEYRIMLNRIDALTDALDDAIMECDYFEKVNVASASFTEAMNLIGRAKNTLLAVRERIEAVEVQE